MALMRTLADVASGTGRVNKQRRMRSALRDFQSRPACGYSEDGADEPGWALAAHSECVLSGDDARAHFAT